MTSIENGLGKVAYKRIDAMGRPVIHQQTVQGLPGETGTPVARAYSTSYAYNAGGLLTSMTYPTGNSISMTYDDAGRSLAVSNAGGVIASAEGGTDPVDNATHAAYAPNGGLQRMVYGATGQVVLTRYNDLFQIKRIQVTGANTLRLDYDYGLSGQNNGNLIKQTINGTIDQNYEHDRLGRLVKTTEGYWRIPWTGCTSSPSNDSQRSLFARLLWLHLAVGKHRFRLPLSPHLKRYRAGTS